MHLGHYVPPRRADGLDLVEDAIPPHDVALSVKTDVPPPPVHAGGRATSWR